MMYRKTYAEINLKHLLDNYLEVSKIVEQKKVIPVVKANAYGHGAIEVVSYLLDHNIDHYAVSLLEEALELKEVFPDIKILVMGSSQLEDFEVAAHSNITLSVSNMKQVEYLKTFQMPLKVHLKVDTGMNRLGIHDEGLIHDVIDVFKDHEFVYLEGIYTHFSTADCDQSYFTLQKDRFMSLLDTIDYEFKMIHVSNSSSSIKYENEFDFTTHVRLGISLYGLTLDKETTFLHNTMKLISHISQIKHLHKGDKVGYGATYEAQGDEIIGVVPIGYADGFIRKNQGGFVEINGRLYEIVGRICMDQMFVKIDETIGEEDDVILMGGKVSIDDVAKRLDTIHYEVICGVTYRVPRIYIKE